MIGFAFAFGLTVLIRCADAQAPGGRRPRDHDRGAARGSDLLHVRDRHRDYWLYWAAGRATRPEDHSGHGAHSWRDYFRVNTDHKVIGIQYMVTSFFFLLVGGMLAMLIRVQLAKPGMQFLTPEEYNGVFSVHATILIFLFVIPVFAGLANFVLPLMIGAPDMAFPRLNALSYWLLPMGGVIMLISFLAPGGSFALGWTAYAPLSTTMPLGQLFFTIGVQFAGFSSIFTALNFLVTIITMRAPGMSFFRMPLLVSGELLHVAAGRDRDPVHRRLAVLRAARPRARLPLLRRVRGGGPQRQRAHVPARLLVLLAPGRLHHDAAGLRDHLRDHRREGAKADLRLPDDGFLPAGDRGPRLHRVAHHMFVSGMSPWIRIPMMITTAIIAVPTGVKIFTWIGTLWGGSLRFTTPMLFAVGFIVMFTIGGLSGCDPLAGPLRPARPIPTYVVAHIHYVLFGGSIFGLFGAIYYWYPKSSDGSSTRRWANGISG